ncbi:hypothetical protein PCASD_25539 [Puccinia coronata f. sp. avenae]|uniref:Uncharacterized protein n=1 Tax=Puccinia coronata f. sp. avenae TaxID=200324 RepID=A0A2N5S7U2_9BASI|nr:hypothetical protein PCASD_26107 [Puccinia coronata f. sp. avenae]PLW26612.1 hypothetical protein PCASD_25539 [Puccinia coronata f. sp. avenae]
MSKCLDWGLFSGPQTRRKYIRRSDIASGEWVPAERNSKPQPPHKTLLAHVFMQLTSIRGSQFPWGHFSQINQNTWQRDLSRLVLCQIYSVTVVAGLLYIKIEELPSIPITHYLGWIGSMPSPTVGCLVRFLTTPFLMSSLGAAFEAVNSCLAVLAHLTHPIMCQLGFPEPVASCMPFHSF